MWAYGEERTYLPDLIAAVDRVSGTVPAPPVVLTAPADELRCRYAREPELYHSLEIVLRANDRFPSLLPMLATSLPSLHTLTTSTSPNDGFAQVDAFLQ